MYGWTGSSALTLSVKEEGEEEERGQERASCGTGKEQSNPLWWRRRAASLLLSERRLRRWTPQGRELERREREGDRECSREEEEEGLGRRMRGGWIRWSEAAYASRERNASRGDWRRRKRGMGMMRTRSSREDKEEEGRKYSSLDGIRCSSPLT